MFPGRDYHKDVAFEIEIMKRQYYIVALSGALRSYVLLGSRGTGGLYVVRPAGGVLDNAHNHNTNTIM